jgi:hypothetical protein
LLTKNKKAAAAAAGVSFFFEIQFLFRKTKKNEKKTKTPKFVDLCNSENDTVEHTFCFVGSSYQRDMNRFVNIL